MKENKILFYILIIIMLVGGIMGIIKGLMPGMDWLSFRHLSGMGGTFNGDNTPAYAVLYGIIMALLEIISSMLLLAKKSAGIKFGIITLSINAAGCMTAILLGDITAVISLIIRFLGIYILIRAGKSMRRGI